jgi:hypothetical protein
MHPEDAANGIERLLAGSFPRPMEEVDDGAVEFSETKFIATDVFRHLRAGGGHDRLKVSDRSFPRHGCHWS